LHDTALAIGRRFFTSYFPDRPGRFLEIGAQDVNGGLRRHAPPGSDYFGVDLCEGEGVDLVLQNPHSLPLASDQYDAALASSCFEHVQMFWLTFLEMVRVAKPGGYIYIDAPSNGAYHCYPTDNWRFYPDAGLALAEWAASHRSEVRLLESFVAVRGADGWSDCVMVFRKGGDGAVDSPGKLAACFPDSFNIRIDGSPAVANRSEMTEDMLLLAQARQQIAGGETTLAELQSRNAALEHSIAELRDQNRASHAAAGQCAERLRALEYSIAEFRDQNRASHAAADQYAERLRAIEHSTAWRATALLRSAAAKLPPPLRRALRRLAKAGAGR
jgi:SAM-dependent methyltransferase